MDNFRDVYLQQALKKWAGACQPPANLRARLLKRAASPAEQELPDLFQAFVLPRRRSQEWSLTFAFQGVVRSYDTMFIGFRTVI